MSISISGVRMSFPIGTKIRGMRKYYIVKSFLSISERSVTMMAEDEDGMSWRVKFYNGDTVVTAEMIQEMRTFNLSVLIIPYDWGEEFNVPFVVCIQENVKNLGDSFFAIQEVRDQVIIPMVKIMKIFHDQGIILRDICSQHIMFSRQDGKMRYIGIGNYTKLVGRANVTKEVGYGENECYMAPEILRYGYSTSSDYYALGVTLLTYIQNKDDVEESWVAEVKRGKIPGINDDYIKKVSYQFLGLRDKVYYLILGLLNPNPQKRWGFDEVARWCKGEMIPLEKEGRPTTYQYETALCLKNKSLWNDQDVSKAIAQNHILWSQETLEVIARFGQNGICSWSQQVLDIVNNRNISVNAKIFRCIYTLYPEMNGFSWEGYIFLDSTQFMQWVIQNHCENQLSEILMYQCFTYLNQMRKKSHQASQFLEFEAFEVMERKEQYQGVRRAKIKFADKMTHRTFSAGDKLYESIDELIEDWVSRKVNIYHIGGSLICENSFQDWLWSRGMEKVGKVALNQMKLKKDSEVLYFLSICETCVQKESTKQLIRKLYLEWGELSPIIWLSSNLDSYKAITAQGQEICETLKNIRIDLRKTLIEIHEQLTGYVSNYQKFVYLNLEDGIVAGQTYKCDCTWKNGLGVCTEFIKSIENRGIIL
ncbi:MAG: protein kinase domain-containing protein [Anaerostipes sp.]|jgi:hypothetical protein